MKKLSNEQLETIHREILNEMYPDYNIEDSDNLGPILINTILAMVVCYIKKYQEKMDD